MIYFISGILLLLAYMFIQAQLFSVNRFYLNTARELKKIFRHKGGSSQTDKAAFRVLHLSDIHIPLQFIPAGRIRKAIRKASPDVIVMTGDYLDKPEHLKKLSRWLKKLDFKVPVLATFGNHDHKCFLKHPEFRGVFSREFSKLNIRLANNEVAFFKKENRRIALVGMDDCKKGKVDPAVMLAGLKEKADTVMVFSHNPDISLLLPENSVDLLLTGHFHGGQLWIPFGLEYTFLRKDRLGKMGYQKGPYLINENSVYISRGIGTVVVPFRFISVPEITVFDL